MLMITYKQALTSVCLRSISLKTFCCVRLRWNETHNASGSATYSLLILQYLQTNLSISLINFRFGYATIKS